MPLVADHAHLGAQRRRIWESVVVVILNVWTENSLYQVDLDRKRIRRVFGANAPAPRFGQDGGWLAFLSVKIPLGHSMRTLWRVDDMDDGLIFRCSVSSPVVCISEAEVLDAENEPTLPPPVAQGEDA